MAFHSQKSLFQDLSIFEYSICTEFPAIMYRDKKFDFIKIYKNGFNYFFCKFEKRGI